MTGAGRAAIAIYLRDADELSSVARVFRGWLGERAAHDGFGWGRSLSWQADPEHPVAVNARGAKKQGRSVDGALPEEMRRGCDLRTPPCYSHYPWEGLGGALEQASSCTARATTAPAGATARCCARCASCTASAGATDLVEGGPGPAQLGAVAGQPPLRHELPRYRPHRAGQEHGLDARTPGGTRSGRMTPEPCGDRE